MWIKVWDNYRVTADAWLMPDTDAFWVPLEAVTKIRQFQPNVIRLDLAHSVCYRPGHVEAFVAELQPEVPGYGHGV